MDANSYNAEEAEKFRKQADLWWDMDGPFKPLHTFNPIRVAYIKEHACARFSRDMEAVKPLEGLRILDIGCGGGLLSEPMARLGASVTGIDVVEQNIHTATVHARDHGLDINYRHMAVEDIKDETFDIVLNMEVVEHVDHPTAFLKTSANLVDKGGMMMVATLNRTPKAWLFAIAGAEYVLRWLPKGTHEWKKFLKPSEVVAPLEDAGLHVEKIEGVTFNPLNQSWKLSKDVSVNYMIRALR